MKKTIYLDVERCVGCGACSVACMDQNDIEPDLGQPAFRRIYRVEDGRHPEASIRFLSVSCRHCEDSPCIMACPTGAIARDEQTHAVIIRKELCIGCHSCAMACPFGMPRYDSADHMDKCTLCTERVEYGLEPACVAVCPFSALIFDSINRIQAEKEAKCNERILAAMHLPVP